MKHVVICPKHGIFISKPKSLKPTVEQVKMMVQFIQYSMYSACQSTNSLIEKISIGIPEILFDAVMRDRYYDDDTLHVYPIPAMLNSAEAHMVSVYELTKNKKGQVMSRKRDEPLLITIKLGIKTR